MHIKSAVPKFAHLANLLQGHVPHNHVLQIHAQVLIKGANQDNLIATRLIGHYPFKLALKIFDQLHNPNIFPFNALIRISSDQRLHPSFAISLFRCLKRHPLSPNDFTFCFVFKACLLESNVVYVKQVHTQVVKVGFLSNSVVCNGLVSAYVKGVKNLGFARKVFDEMSERSGVGSWTCLINGYAKSGLSDEALRLFLLMVRDNVVPDNATMVGVLSACAKLGGERMGEWVKIFAEYVEDGNAVSCAADAVNTVLTYLYGKCGRIEVSRETFDRIGDAGKKNVATWNTMINAYVQNGSALEALSLFRMMMDYPCISPNHVTMVSVLSACSQVGDIDLGIWVHEYLRSQGRKDILRTNSLVATAMIDMYCRCGDLSRAKEVFISMFARDVISYNVIIIGLAVNGKGHEALSLFSEMLGCGLCPNGGTFLGVLSACSHSGLLEVGRQIFQNMETEFSVKRQLEHYACYIDLLARVGLIEEALDVAKTMPFKPNNFVWGALLGGCLLHYRGKLTQDISKRLIEVDPQNSAGYVMLSNALAHDREWGEVSGLRRFMMEKGVEKQRGSSWISLDGVVHEFLVGTSSHPELSCISSILDGLFKEMKRPGYITVDDMQALL